MSWLFDLQNTKISQSNHTPHTQITLKIQRGERIALVGASGAGKTTLLHHLYQCQPDVCALCPLSGALVPQLSVFHNIYMGTLHQHRLLYNLANLIRPLKRERGIIEELCRTLGIADKLYISVDRLSGGQQQRIALGRSLIQNCPVFLGDEPTSSVDEQQSLTLLQKVLTQHETTIVALHNRQLALNLFDRVIGMKDGHIVLDAPASTLNAQSINTLYD